MSFVLSHTLRFATSSLHFSLPPTIPCVFPFFFTSWRVAAQCINITSRHHRHPVHISPCALVSTSVVPLRSQLRQQPPSTIILAPILSISRLFPTPHLSCFYPFRRCGIVDSRGRCTLLALLLRMCLYSHSIPSLSPYPSISLSAGCCRHRLPLARTNPVHTSTAPALRFTLACARSRQAILTLPPRRSLPDLSICLIYRQHRNVKLVQLPPPRCSLSASSLGSSVRALAPRFVLSLVPSVSASSHLIRISSQSRNRRRALLYQQVSASSLSSPRLSPAASATALYHQRIVIFTRALQRNTATPSRLSHSASVSLTRGCTTIPRMPSTTFPTPT